MNNYYGKSWDGKPINVDNLAVSTSNSFIQRVFSIMGLGLAITGLTAYGASLDEGLMATLFGTNLRWLLLLSPFIFVLIMNYGVDRLSYATSTIIFGLYSITMGLFFSVIFLVYTKSSIASTFFVTSLMFGFMAAYGYFTKRDLSSWGSILFMGLIGIVIASIINIFIGSGALEYIKSFFGVIIFCGFTAYDMFNIKQAAAYASEDSEQTKKISLLMALGMYLNFVNMFLFLLRFFGSNRN